MIEVPVLLIIFNRPDLAAEVIDSIKKVRPSRLYIAADGPRLFSNDDHVNCNEAREVVLNAVDWPCQIFTRFHENNLGCGLALSSAISWFFEMEEAGIILEDDCVASEDFFQFCQVLLKKYAKIDKIMHIAGFNDQNGVIRGDGSYYFSKFPKIWGWATWRRSWKHYDFETSDIDEVFPEIAEEVFCNDGKTAKNWLKLLFENIEGSWDYQWDYTIFKNNGLCITPNVSLIKNIGFDSRATHTVNLNEKHQGDLGKISKVVHPKELIRDIDADMVYMRKHFYEPFLKRIKSKMKGL